MSKCKNLFLLFTLFLFTGLSFNSYAGPVCGDGVVDAPEECDEGQLLHPTHVPTKLIWAMAYVWIHSAGMASYRLQMQLA